MIITTSHAGLINGKLYESPANTMVELLVENKKNFLFIRHAMNGEFPSTIYHYKKGKLIKEQKLFVISKLSVLRYSTEIIATVLYFLNKKTEEYVFIGVNPLGALSGVILKKLGKIKKVIFYTPDYSPKRFSNPVLNYVYHWVDRFCVKNADFIWNVSTRICEIRRRMGVSEEKNIFLPNIPSEQYKKFLGNPKRRYSLITLGIIKDQLDFYGTFEAIKQLRIDYPEIIFKIIGTGPKEAEYKKYVEDNDLTKNVNFFGYLEHEEALREISESEIGLALYNGKWAFNRFGDSMKCREFFCFGLPVVTTDTHSTVDEITKYNAGIVCRMDPSEYVKAIREILENYDKFSNNAKKLAEKHEDVHQNLIKKFLT